MRKFKLGKLGKLRKSTKILLIILGVVVLTGVILSIVYRQNLLAYTTPPPEDIATGGDHGTPYTKDKTPIGQGCDKDCINSGGTFYVQCKTEEELINAPALDIDGDGETDSYRIDSYWYINFEPEDDEYIKEAYIDVAGESEIALNIGQGLESPYADIYSLIFKPNWPYLYRIKLEIYDKSGNNEGDIYSNACRANIDQYNNKVEGGQVSGGKTYNEVVYEDGKYQSSCDEICSGEAFKIWDWRNLFTPILISKLIDYAQDENPITKSLCQINCRILEVFGLFFNWAMMYLEGAIGIS